MKWKRKPEQLKPRDYKARCPGCGRQCEFGGDDNEFHPIPNIHGAGWSLIYCKDCNTSLTIAKKKELVWYICARSRDEAEALHHLERGRHLCAQIDNGL